MTTPYKGRKSEYQEGEARRNLLEAVAPGPTSSPARVKKPVTGSSKSVRADRPLNK